MNNTLAILQKKPAEEQLVTVIANFITYSEGKFRINNEKKEIYCTVTRFSDEKSQCSMLFHKPWIHSYVERTRLPTGHFGIDLKSALKSASASIDRTLLYICETRPT